MLAAPINPADLNTIEGVYPIRPQLPAVPGSEGVGTVVDVGDQVSHVKVGDWVIPAMAAVGTWRNIVENQQYDWIPIRNDVPVEIAAAVGVNPSTAWTMLKLWGSEGNTIVQNAGNSGVGIAVSQLAKRLGVNVVSVVRQRKTPEEHQEMENELERLGAKLVLTEEKAQDTKFVLGELEKLNLKQPTVAFNAVGGLSSLNLAKLLAPKGKMITYGGMSMKPVSIPTGPLIFKDISVHGFWMSRWVKEASRDERKQMVDELLDIASQGGLEGKFEKIAFENLHQAIERAKTPFRNSKVLLVFD
jgi:trans-2-enoyl-CoA reductase